MDARKLLDRAAAADRAGRHDEAERMLEKILRYQNDNATAARMLASLRIRGNRLSDAEAILRSAIEAAAKVPAAGESEALQEMLIGLLVRTNPAEAEQRAVHATTGRAVSLNIVVLQGDAQLAQRKYDAAIDTFRAAVEAAPARSFLRVRLGHALRAAGRMDEAIEATREAVRIDPNAPEPHHALGMLLQDAGQFDLAESAFRRAIELRRDYISGHGALAALLQRVGRYVESLRAHETAIALHPRSPLLQLSLGHLHMATGKLDEAEAAYRRAAELNPSFAAAWSSIASLLAVHGRPFAAVEAGEKAVAADPSFGPAFAALGHARHAIGDAEEAAKFFARGWEVSGDPEIGSNLLHTLNYVATFSKKDVYDTHREWAERHADSVPSPFDHSSRRFDSGRRVRVGYVSPDFRAHAVSHFVEPLLAGHDRSRFEVFCYSSVGREDEVTARLRSYAEHWRDIRRIRDEDAARLIHDDGVDILVDLAGHTARHRLAVFALRPAPIQVTYQGYPNTTGLTAIDYRLTDSIADPPDADEFHSEKLLRLPRTSWCYRPKEEAPEVAPLPALGGEPFTFGSFNRLSKVSPQTASLWSRAVRAVPNARLMFKTAGLDEPATERHVRELFARFGLSGDRLILVGNDPSPLDHLRRYGRIDVALDSFPYHGTATSCEALWMGVPSITLVGDRHVSRVGLSLLTNIGLGQFAVLNEDAYIARAAATASDLPELANIRSTMRERLLASPLMQTQQFCADVEAAYDHMIQAYHQGNG